MSETLRHVQLLVASRNYRVSEHAYVEMAEDGILPLDVINGLASAMVVEDYPDAVRGPTVLVLCKDPTGQPVHALWGMPRARMEIAVLITTYRPVPERWSDDFLQRRRN